MSEKLKIGQKVYTFGGMGLPRGMMTVVGTDRKGKLEGYAIRDAEGNVWGAIRSELMDEKDAIAHAYAIFKGFTE